MFLERKLWFLLYQHLFQPIWPMFLAQSGKLQSNLYLLIFGHYIQQNLTYNQYLHIVKFILLKIKDIYDALLVHGHEIIETSGYYLHFFDQTESKLKIK